MGTLGNWFIKIQLFKNCVFFRFSHKNLWILLFLTLNANQGRVITPAFQKILVRKLTLRHADEWQSTCSTFREKKLMTSTSLYSKIHLIQQHLVQVDILFEVLRMFWNFSGRVSGQLNTFTCKSKGLVNICIFFGTVIDHLNHFTCKSMEIHTSI